ncbi:MAG: hypothetical protein M1457_07940 [bacterium]|nr:hypothetical protein [bacterium]
MHPRRSAYFIFFWLLAALARGEIANGDFERGDLTGNWRDTARYEPRIQTREPELEAGVNRTFRQTLDLPAGRYALAIEYDPNLDKKRNSALGQRLDNFTSLTLNGRPLPLAFMRPNAKAPYRARRAFAVEPGDGPIRLALTLHDTRPPRTWLLCDRPLPGGTRYRALTPAAEGELLIAHGIPFLARRLEWFRSSLQQGADHGDVAPWQGGMELDCGRTPVRTAYFLGMIHNIDLGNGSWYSPKGDDGYSHFVGDRAGSIVITFGDDTQTTVPLVFGYNLWFCRPWDMIWNYNWNRVAPGVNRDAELFGGSEQDRDTIRNGLALVDGIRRMGSDSANARFIFALDLGGRTVKSIQVRGVPELHDHPLISAVTLEMPDEPQAKAEAGGGGAGPLTPLPELCPDEANIPPVSLDTVVGADWRAGVEHIMRLFYAFVDELPRLAQPEIPEGYFGPDYDFQGAPDAVYAACFLYRNGPECASHIADSALGCPSPTASGQLCQYLDGMGVWFRNPTFYRNVTDWFERYRAGSPGHFPGGNHGWTRGEGPLLREAVAFGYDKYAGTYIDWLDGALMTEANPPHWNRVAGLASAATYAAKVGDVTERGNRENDGHGLCMTARAMVWHWLGRPRDWNERRWRATAASAEWLQWQLDTDTIRPGARKDVLYTESECAHDSYDIYSTYNCIHGLKLAIALARQLGRETEVEGWTRLRDRLRQGCLDHLVDSSEFGPIWHTDPHCDWQDHAHKLVPVTLASDGDTYTPLQAYGAGDALDRRFLEISRNSYRYLMKDRNYNCLRMYGYGQGYMTQAALLLDQMADATQFLDMLLRHCYLPRLGGWTCPEGIILHRSGKYYLPVNGYMGQDVHVAESTKALRLMLGVDDNDPAHLRLVPRYPAAWTRLAIDKYPVLTGDRRQLCRYDYERSDGGQTFAFGFERPVERLSMRLGPIPADREIKRATFNGRPIAHERQHSGDSDWVWARDLSGRTGIVEIQFK